MLELFKRILRFKFLSYFLFLILISSVVFAGDWTYSPGEVNVYVFGNHSLWNKSGADNILPFNALDGFQIPSLASCDTIDSDADGIFSCGTDATGDNPAAYKKGNYSEEYSATGYDKENRSEEYSATGFDNENATDQLATNISNNDVLNFDDLNTTEHMQDACAAALVNDTGVNFTYDDANNKILVNISSAYRLPQGCSNGQIGEYNTGTGEWDCANDDTGAGGDTSDLDIVNQSMFDNVTVIRTHNSTWTQTIIEQFTGFWDDFWEAENFSSQYSSVGYDAENFTKDLAQNISNGDLLIPSNTSWIIANQFMPDTTDWLNNYTLQAPTTANWLTNYTTHGATTANWIQNYTFHAPTTEDFIANYSIVAPTSDDFTNNLSINLSQSSGIILQNLTVVNTNFTLGNVSIIQYNSSCAGFRFNNSLDAGGLFSCMP